VGNEARSSCNIIRTAYSRCRAALLRGTLVATILFATLNPGLAGCVASSSQLSESGKRTAACPAPPKQMPALSVAGAFSLTSDELACYGDELRVQCGFLHGISPEDRAACETYTKAIVTYLTRELGSRNAEPTPMSPVRYKDGGVCLDTFIPGREMEDCFDYIEAGIRLEPVPPGKSQDSTYER
jgi:hypothetical protein